jgi:polyphosphate kinase 2 (PPK2 family)
MNNREMKDFIKKARKIAKPFRVADDRFRLKDIDPRDTLKFTSEDKPRAKEALAMGVDLLAQLQDMLYAQDRWAILLIFQAMDAAGKDGAIKHVMSGDAKEREHWNDYMEAYEDMIQNTATKHAPWYVVSADNKWFTRVVAAAVIEALSSLDLHYPKVSEDKLKELAAAKKTLLAGK